MEIPHCITQRPEAANLRTRLGDWEADTVAGKLGEACLLTLVDRRSRYLICRRLERKGSEEVAQETVKVLWGQPIQTITSDRGSEFRHHTFVTQALGQVQFYFAQPHHPWQRGTNENTNGLLREFFPKGYDLSDITPEAVQKVQNELNLRPRKILGFRTPAEVHLHLSLHLT